MRQIDLLIACCLLLAGYHAGAESLPDFDHHDPAALNEAAARLAKVGAGGTALILLERAKVIFPEDASTTRNLAALRAYLANPGTITLSAPGDTVSRSETSADPTFPPLPAPWPRR